MKKSQFVFVCLLFFSVCTISFTGKDKVVDATPTAAANIYFYAGSGPSGASDPGAWSQIYSPPTHDMCPSGSGDYCLINFSGASYTLAEAVSLLTSYVNNSGGLSNKGPSFSVLDEFGQAAGITASQRSLF
ncbi:hypothetical protein GCM10007415_02420 [Parapedobacter pyrenivorans]|uniref:Uncharacterized protein n=1 Tax=Parapedobacter pyrenivorans TaxID=1305674 RepID=A0A917HDF6_9SPHI|nr:hypothetical protein [Parapedobacter pyrenivorans]GGG74455.1 hypothetical protein GCM10007415_02420 [Parapedobacter pyrenivorans]